MKGKFWVNSRPAASVAELTRTAPTQTVILTSTQARIEGCRITAYKRIVQGQTWNDLLRHAEEIGANAVLNTPFDDGLDVDTLFHGAAVVVQPERSPHAAQTIARRRPVPPWSAG
jgi:hypothetical protein